MEMLLNNAPCFYFSCKDDGNIIAVNNTLCRHLGFTQQELIGRKIDIILTIASRIFQQTHFFPLLKMHGHAEEIYITLQGKDKSIIPVLINAKRIIENEEAANVHIGIIVQNRKKYEDEIVAAKKAAELALQQNTNLLKAQKELQLNKEKLDEQLNLIHKQNAELLQFNKVVSHDLQEPLRKLSVFANMLLLEREGLEKVDVVEKLIQVSKQMRLVVTGLQQFVWLTDASMQSSAINLNTLVKPVSDELKNDFPSTILKINKDKLPIIKGDRAQIKLFLYHVLSNAIRFKKQGKEVVEVKISCTNLKLNKFKSLKDSYLFTEHIKIEISDDGVGFSDEFQNQIFELFKKLHPQSGLGIGLALSRKIIENHHGSIKINSKPSQGTVVTVLLPLL